MKKGFTLIELLVSIVILAIISLIATPTILGVIDKAKENSAKSSASGYMDAIYYYFINSAVNDELRKLKPNIKYNVNSGTIIDSEYYEPLNEYISLKGEKTTGIDDYIIIDKNGLIVEGKFTISGYEMAIEVGKVTTIEKGKIVEIEEINIADRNITMELNSSYQTTLKILPNNASDQRITYKTNNDNIIVDNYGKITAKKIGNSIITIESKSNSNVKTTINI